MRTAKADPDLSDLVCPITHELPTRPVVAQDGRVYDEIAWLTYIKSKKRGKTVKSPWTMKAISKEAHFSAPIRQVIEKAVRDGHVSKDLHPSWTIKMQQEKEIEKLKKEVKKNAMLAMVLGDHYYNGTCGVFKQIELAYGFYEKGYNRTSDAQVKQAFYIRMLLCTASLPSKTRTDLICIWSSLCQMMTDDVVSYTVHTIMEKLDDRCRSQVAKMSGLLHKDEYKINFDWSSSNFIADPELKQMADDCAKELADFLNENNDNDESDSESDEDSESEDSE